MELRVFNSITEVDKKIWDSIIPKAEILKKYDFLRIIESSNINDCIYRYLMVYEYETLVASATLFCMKFQLDILSPEFIKKASSFIRKFYPGFLTLSLLGCGPVLSTCTDSVSVSDANYFQDVLPLIAAEMQCLAKEKRCHLVLFKDITAGKVHYFDNLKSMGFLKLYNLPNSVLDIRWNSFSEYVEGLRKKYRQVMKKNLSRINNNGIQVSLHEDWASIGKDLWPLYMNVYNKSDYKFEKLTEKFFESMPLHMQGGSKVILFRSMEKTVAFVLFVEENQ
ncbi:MAG: peptidogalycan biosysnthesis protein [Syntrophobacteraceae bacterium]